MVTASRELFSDIDELATAAMLHAALQSPEVILMRGEQACIGVYCYRWPYNPKIIMAEDMFIANAGDNAWELLAVFGEICKVLRKGGVQELKFDLSSFSKTGKSLDPFAKRLGASADRPTYRIDLRNLH